MSKEMLTELQLAMNAGARAIEQNKKLQGIFYCYDPLGNSQEIPYAEAARILRNTDAVPVVRCGDCIHWRREDAYCKIMSGYCENEEFFCACGRRKE